MTEFKVTCLIDGVMGPGAGRPHTAVYFCEAADAAEAKDMVLLNHPDMRHAEVTVKPTGKYLEDLEGVES